MSIRESESERLARYTSVLVHYGPVVLKKTCEYENIRVSEEMLTEIATKNNRDLFVCLMVAVTADHCLENAAADRVVRHVANRLIPKKEQVPSGDIKRLIDFDFRRIVRDLSRTYSDPSPIRREETLLNCEYELRNFGITSVADALQFILCQWFSLYGHVQSGSLTHESHQIHTPSDSTWRMSALRSMLRGDLSFHDMDVSRGKMQYDKALKAFRTYGDHLGVARVLRRLAYWTGQHGSGTDERGYLTRSAKEYVVWDHDTVFFEHRMLVGRLSAAKGYYKEALLHFERAIGHSESIGGYATIEARIEAGRAEIIVGRFSDARSHLQQINSLMFGIRVSRYLNAEVTLYKAELDYAQDDLDRGLVQSRVAQDLFGDRARGLVHALLLEAQIQIFARNWSEAKRACDSAISIASMRRMSDEHIRGVVCRHQIFNGLQQLEGVREEVSRSPKTENVFLRGQLLEVEGDALALQAGGTLSNNAARRYVEARNEYHKAGYVTGEAGVLLKQAKLGLKDQPSRAIDLLKDAHVCMRDQQVTGMRAQVLVYLATLENSTKVKGEYMLEAAKIISESRSRALLPRHQYAYIQNMNETLEAIALYLLNDMHDGELFALEMLKPVSDQLIDGPNRAMYVKDSRSEELEQSWRTELTRRINSGYEQSAQNVDSVLVRIYRNKIDSIRVDQLPYGGRLSSQIPKLLDTLPRFQRKVLRPKEALLNYVILNNELFAVLVMQNRIIKHSIGKMSASELRELRIKVDRLASLQGMSLQSVSDSVVKILGVLHQQLIQPIATHLNGLSHILLIQDDRLPTLPIEGMLMYVQDRLCDSVVHSLVGVSRYLSISHLVHHRETPAGHNVRQTKGIVFAGLGYPTLKMDSDEYGGMRSDRRSLTEGQLLHPVDRQSMGHEAFRSLSVRSSNLTALEHADREIDSIAGLFDNRGSSFERYYAARKRDVVNALHRNIPYIHVACHGSTDSTRHILFLNGTKESDNILDVAEIAGWRLWGVRLLTLAACHSGSTEVINIDGLSGFMRAFVRSGVKAVVGALWKINDLLAKEVMVAFYRYVVAGDETSLALAKAKLDVASAMKDSGKCSFALVQLSAYVLYGN